MSGASDTPERVFEDILRLDDRLLLRTLPKIDSCLLALALKTATPELKEKLFRNMSRRSAGVIGEEMEYIGPVRLSEVERAQRAVCAILFPHAPRE